MSLVGRLSRLFDLDSALIFGLATRIVSAALAPATTLIIAFYLSPQLQGYFYTFISLTAMQAFVELGLTGVITTFASHEWSQLTRSADGSISGDARALSRLSSLASFSVKWFAGVAVVVVILFLVGGLNFLSAKGHDVEWRWPWILLSVATGLNIMFIPGFALLMGCGEVRTINAYRLIDTLLRFATVWAVLVMGGGLWASALSAVAVTVWASIYLLSRHARFFIALKRAAVVESIQWKKGILPLQLKTALMWPSGFLMFSLFTPALFYYQGPVVAGQMGMSWALTSGIAGLAGTWLQVRTPQFGGLVARQDFVALDSLLKKATSISFSVAVVGAIAVFIALALLSQYMPWWRSRLLPTLPIMIFLLAESLNQLSYAQAGYLRSFKQEPFFWLSTVCGWTVGVWTVLSSKYAGVTWVATGYLLGAALALAWGSLIFFRFRRKRLHI